MITLWSILGRAALDGAFRDSLTKLATRNDIKQSLMRNLQDNGYRISLFEVWELARFLTLDLDPQKKPLLPQVEAIYKGVDPPAGTPTPEFCAVIGLALIDKRVALEIDGKKSAKPALDRFLTRDPLHFYITFGERDTIANMFEDAEMYKLCEQFNAEYWEDNCEEGAIYDIAYDKLHPTGPDVSDAGSWYNFVWIVSLLDEDDLLRKFALHNNAHFLKRCAGDSAVLPKLQEIVCPTCPAPVAVAAAKKKAAKKKAAKKKAAKRPGQ